MVWPPSFSPRVGALPLTGGMMDSKDLEMVSLHRNVTNDIVASTGWPSATGWITGVGLIPLMDALAAELDAIVGWNS